MKKRISEWLLRLAKLLDPQKEIETIDRYTARQLGIGYHISKSDVRKFRKEHPEYTSHRKGLDALVEDTKTIIFGHIVAGIKDKNLVDYNVKKSLWTADVTGILNVYVLNNEADGEQKTAK